MNFYEADVMCNHMLFPLEFLMNHEKDTKPSTFADKQTRCPLNFLGSYSLKANRYLILEKSLKNHNQKSGWKSRRLHLMTYEILDVQVQIFWEGRYIWKNLPLRFRYSVASHLSGIIFQIIAAFSEYLNFKLVRWDHRTSMTPLCR